MALLRTIGLIFVLVGLLLAGISAWSVARQNTISETYASAHGTVERFVIQRGDRGESDSYRAVIHFRDGNGQRREFAESVSTYPARFAAGDSVKVLYNPNRPSDAYVDDASGRYLLSYITGGLGAAFLFIGGPMVAISAISARRRKALKKSHLMVFAEFQRSFIDERVKINSRSPYRVVVQARHPATGKMRDFESDPIWVDLTDVLKGERIPVHLDPDDSSNFMVDLSAYIDGNG